MLIVRKLQININTNNILLNLQSLTVGMPTLDKLFYSLHINMYKHNLMID